MRKFSRKRASRDHLVRNLATSLVLFEMIETTEPKAKETKTFIDTILSRSKAGDLNAIKYLHTIFFDKNAVDKIVKELLPRYAKRESGFVKSFHLKNRLGDNAAMMRLELIDRKVFVDKKEDKPVEESKIKESKAEDAK